MKKIVMVSLFNEYDNISENEYKNHILEQYKVYAESVEKISDRRTSTNSYILTFHTILISILSFIFQSDSFENLKLIKFIIPIIGIVISIISWFLIHSYKQLNTGKFKVLHEIEKKLPLALYEYEREILGKGKKFRIYFPFSKVEQFIPIVFGIIYLLFIIILIVK